MESNEGRAATCCRSAFLFVNQFSNGTIISLCHHNVLMPLAFKLRPIAVRSSSRTWEAPLSGGTSGN
jgi:hypothetical protein